MKKTLLQFRPNMVIKYTVSSMSNTQKTLNKWRLQEKTRERKPYSGEMTINTRKRLRRVTNILILTSKKQVIKNPITKKQPMHQLTMITLTQPNSSISKNAKECYKKLLKPFIQWLTKTEKINTYIWKLEYQQSGNVHYHIISNAFIEYWRIKEKWNYLLRKNGCLESYRLEYGHTNPNSTDIKELNNIDNTAAYLEKYLSKSYQNKGNDKCKLWDCSYNLKKSKLFTVEVLPQNLRELNKIQQDETCKILESDFFTIYESKQISSTRILYGYQHKLYDEWYNSVRTLHKIKSTLEKTDYERDINKWKQLGLF